MSCLAARKKHFQQKLTLCPNGSNSDGGRLAYSGTGSGCMLGPEQGEELPEEHHEDTWPFSALRPGKHQQALA